jgi:glycine amidinotransferase
LTAIDILQLRSEEDRMDDEVPHERTYVSCWTEWGRLRHVIVGSAAGACVPPPEPGFSSRLPPNSDLRTWRGRRPAEAIERATEQLEGLVDVLRRRGVRVDRPTPLNFDEPVETPDFEQGCMFGCAAPRDLLVTIGREMLEATMSLRSRWFEYLAYRPLLRRYFREDTGMRHEAAPKPRLADDSFREGYLDDVVTLEQRLEWIGAGRFVTTEVEPLFDAADILRCGRDLFVQQGFTTNLAGIGWLRRHFPELRVHGVRFPGDPYPSHIDATLVLLRPGLALNNPARPPRPEDREIFDRNGWEIVPAAQPAHDRSPPLCYSSVWLSMNVLSLDEKTVCVESSERAQMEQLNSLGFEVLPVPFREVYPFGGGLHCATADVWREGALEDYFPVQEGH